MIGYATFMIAKPFVGRHKSDSQHRHPFLNSDFKLKIYITLYKEGVSRSHIDYGKHLFFYCSTASIERLNSLFAGKRLQYLEYNLSFERMI